MTHAVEALALVLVLVLLLVRARAGRPAGAGRVLPALARLGRRPLAAPAAVFAVTLALAAAVSTLVHRPLPQVHDEFSYLLAAETYATGRLALPAHPEWRHLESFHVLQQPVHASKYPPGQGLFLAAGRLLFGAPIAGAWLASALAAAALVFALRPVLPPAWSLAAGLLFALKVGMASSWSQSYWGGSVAALGGALAFGGALRLLTSGRSAPAAAVLGTGLGLVAVSRPYEGLLFALVLGAALLPAALRLGRHRPRALVAGLFAGAAALAPWLLFFAAVNKAVTGHPLRTAHGLHEATYTVAPTFAFQPLRPVPEYRHAELRRLHAGPVVAAHQNKRTLAGLAGAALDRAHGVWKHHAGVALALPLLLAPWAAPCSRAGRRREPAAALAGARAAAPAVAVVATPAAARSAAPAAAVAAALAVAAVGVVMAGTLLVVSSWPHYTAPITAPLWLLVGLGLRRLRTLRCGRSGRRKRVGRALAAAVVAAVVVSAVAEAAARPGQQRGFSEDRAAVRRALLQDGRRHVVLVEYRAPHSYHQEWVHADGDHQRTPVLWARSMGPAEDARFLAAVADRRAWRLQATYLKPARLVPHPLAGSRRPRHDAGSHLQGAPAP